MAHFDPVSIREFLSRAAAELEQARPVTRWSTWKIRAAVPIAMGALLAGCGDTVETPAGEGQCQGCDEECSDGVDNDADGTLDCDDPDCALEEPCSTNTGGTGGTGGADTGGSGGSLAGGTGGSELGGLGGVAYGIPYEYDCSDGHDNDFDGLVDCDDADCLALCGSADYAIPYEYDCANAIDDDGDTLIDCDDPDCTLEDSCSTNTGGTGGMATGGTGGTGGVVTGGTGGLETGGTGGVPTGGTGGVETGGTGASGLAGAPAYGIPYEYDCSDGYDNDFDGLIDCHDADCLAICGSPEYAIPYEYDCTNAIDDDGDTLIDCDDPDCTCGAGGTGGTDGSGLGGRYAIPF